MDQAKPPRMAGELVGGYPDRVHCHVRFKRLLEPGLSRFKRQNSDICIHAHRLEPFERDTHRVVLECGGEKLELSLWEDLCEDQITGEILGMGVPILIDRFSCSARFPDSD